MGIKKLLLPFMLISSVAALVRRAAAVPAQPEPASRCTSYDAIDAYVLKEMRRLKIPGASLAIVEGNQIVHLRGFGRVRSGGEAPGPQTPFFIASLTKSITALAIMQLVEAGKIALDDPVQRYLPWFQVADPRASAQITVRHLLNQTSGLPGSSGETELANFDNRPDATERQARALASTKLKHPVGSKCEYANMNYNLLGLIIEAASGEDYAAYIQKYIFAPLEMNHTYTSPTAARENGLAMGHRYWFGIPFAAPNLPFARGSLPSGQLASTAEDMGRFLIAHLNHGRYGNNQILSGSGFDELHRGVMDYRKMGVSAGKYGMGWFVGKLGDTKILWHSGTLPDFGACMALLPEQDKGLVLLSNASHHWNNPIVAELGICATALLAGKEYERTPFLLIMPWILRSQLLIPILQLIGFTNTLRLLRHWRLEPERRPSGGNRRRFHILLPLIFNLLVAASLKPMLSRRRNYLLLYMPDYSWLAMICGSFALVWGFLRTGLVLRALKTSSPP